MSQIKTKAAPPGENKMGFMPVNKLLITMSIPMMISMLVQALYNIVDSIFVAQISENALTAVSLAFPAQNLMIAVGSGTGVGINALLSKSLGEKDYERVDAAANTGIFLYFMNFLAFAVLGLLFSRPFFLVQTNIHEIVDGGTIYLRICTLCSFGISGQFLCERLLQSTGRTFYSMITQGVGAILNIIFDPILIFGLLGFPKMGIAGAAVATVFGQIVAFGLGLYLNIRKNPEIHLNFRKFYINGPVIRQVYAVGVPSIIMMSIGSVMTFGLNKILIAFTATASAVLGVYFKLQSFVFMPIFGMNNGLVPIIAYNYGARKPDRLMKAWKLSIVYALCIMLAGFLVFQFCPTPLLRLFNASDTMLEIGVPALRIISSSFLLAGFCIVTSSLFQALSHGVISLIISLVRQLIVLLPAAYFLSLTGKLSLIWWAFPLAELFSLALTILFLIRVYRQDIRPMQAS